MFIKPEPKKSILGLDRLAEKKRLEDLQVKKYDEDPGSEIKEERLVKSGTNLNAHDSKVQALTKV